MANVVASEECPPLLSSNESTTDIPPPASAFTADYLIENHDPNLSTMSLTPPTSGEIHNSPDYVSADDLGIISGMKINPMHSCGNEVSTALRIRTNMTPRSVPSDAARGCDAARPKTQSLLSSPTCGLPFRRPSKKSTSAVSSESVGSLTPPSIMSSPALNSLLDITPLPSPITLDGSWDQMAPVAVSALTSPIKSSLADPILISPAEREPNSTPFVAQQKRKAYGELDLSRLGVHSMLPTTTTHQTQNPGSRCRTRDVSEYVPETPTIRKPRHITVSESKGVHPMPATSLPRDQDNKMHREQYLAVQRGLAGPGIEPPTPPASNTGAETDPEDTRRKLGSVSSQSDAAAALETFEAEGVRDHKRKRYIEISELGVGTFSRVLLATSQGRTTRFPLELGRTECTSLVAIKIVQHGPAGGASEVRVETSFQRELEILQSIHHPSLVHLKAFGTETTRSFLVLTYCPGGDMYDVASERHHLLVPSLIQRIFAELVAATMYLHENLIVHRDIKLENVLFNIPTTDLPTISDWHTYPHPVVTLTDMGLSRRINPDEPKLSTRCGSEDYASPELLMGQPYDGRQTDAWALGVLLYAIMEGRLPFDPLPGASEQQKMRSRTVHRIARVDWRWYRHADDEGEPSDFGDLLGAQTIVEGLLKRATRRLDLQTVAGIPWVKEGIQVDGGLKLLEDCDDS